jgi:16S rRNA processing protein RimM
MVGILKEELPKLDADTYYWSDLMGLDVQNEAGYYFGSIQTMMETGSNDVMVIKGEREFLIPYLPDVIIKVDLEAKKVLVDWDENY